jgi:hypothetical protein
VTNKPLDHDSIARAMKEAAWVAKHGTREQRAGRFMPNVPQSSLTKEEPRKLDRK